MEIIIVLLWPLCLIPIITGYMDTSHGRSFWRWFGIGWVLPYFSLLLITYVVYRDQRRARSTHSDTSNSDLP